MLASAALAAFLAWGAAPDCCDACQRGCNSCQDCPSSRNLAEAIRARTRARADYRFAARHWATWQPWPAYDYRAEYDYPWSMAPRPWTGADLPEGSTRVTTFVRPRPGDVAIQPDGPLQVERSEMPTGPLPWMVGRRPAAPAKERSARHAPSATDAGLRYPN
jgi:hypothetical protein